jgi:hypothetical protein
MAPSYSRPGASAAGPVAASFDIMIVGQKGRLEAEAALFAASLRAADPGFAGRLFVAEPSPDRSGPPTRAWKTTPAPSSPPSGPRSCPSTAATSARPIPTATRPRASRPPRRPPLRLLRHRHAGDRPALRHPLRLRPPLRLDGADEHLARDRALRPRLHRHVARALRPLRARLRQLPRPLPARRVLAPLPLLQRGLVLRPLPPPLRRAPDRDDGGDPRRPPPALVCQPLYPWLDQIALPLVIHEAGGGRPGPGTRRPSTARPRATTARCRSSTPPPDDRIAFLEEIAGQNRVKKVLKRHDPFRRMIYQGKGARSARSSIARTCPVRVRRSRTASSARNSGSADAAQIARAPSRARQCAARSFMSPVRAISDSSGSNRSSTSKRNASSPATAQAA